MKDNAFKATEELDNEIDILLFKLSEKYAVKINTNSDYSKGTIRISIKDKP